MRVLNGVIDANDTDLNQVRGALYDRFYTPPADSYAATFKNEDWDWSGGARGSGWTTLITPTFYLTATHSTGSLGFFYPDDDPAAVWERLVVGAGLTWPKKVLGTTRPVETTLGVDLTIVRFRSAASSAIDVYPIFTVEDMNDLISREVYVFGQSEDGPQFNGVSALAGVSASLMRKR